MTDRERQDEWLRSHSSAESLNAAGDDLSLIRENLRLTPTERFLRYQAAAQLALEFFHAGKRAGLHDIR